MYLSLLLCALPLLLGRKLYSIHTTHTAYREHRAIYEVCVRETLLLLQKKKKNPFDDDDEEKNTYLQQKSKKNILIIKIKKTIITL